LAKTEIAASALSQAREEDKKGDAEDSNEN
jgi:hypothetical protein